MVVSKEIESWVFFWETPEIKYFLMHKPTWNWMEGRTLNKNWRWQDVSRSQCGRRTRLSSRSDVALWPFTWIVRCSVLAMSARRTDIQGSYSSFFIFSKLFISAAVHIEALSLVTAHLRTDQATPPRLRIQLWGPRTEVIAPDVLRNLGFNYIWPFFGIDVVLSRLNILSQHQWPPQSEAQTGPSPKAAGIVNIRFS